MPLCSLCSCAFRACRHEREDVTEALQRRCRRQDEIVAVRNPTARAEELHGLFVRQYLALHPLVTAFETPVLLLCWILKHMREGRTDRVQRHLRFATVSPLELGAQLLHEGRRSATLRWRGGAGGSLDDGLHHSRV